MVSSWVSLGFRLDHVTCFGQQQVGRSDGVLVLSLGLKKCHIFPLAFLHIYHFDEKNGDQGLTGPRKM